MYYSEFLCTGEQFKNVLTKSIGLHVDVVFAFARVILGIRFDIHLIQHLRLFSDHIAQFHNILYRIFVKFASAINITQQIAKKIYKKTPTSSKLGRTSAPNSSPKLTSMPCFFVGRSSDRERSTNTASKSDNTPSASNCPTRSKR
jgi:hypothetical protein